MQTRSYFKSGFYDEMMGDAKKALKHYQRALEFLAKEPTPVDPARLMEVKVVAEMIALRSCRVLMSRGDVAGACEKLQKVIHEFKNRTGPESLAFQHWGWLAHVNEAFGKMLEEHAARAGGDGAQTENPGSFFQAAAHYTNLRRAAALRRRHKVGPANLPVTDSLPDTPSRLDVARQKFVGQPYEEFQHPLEQKGLAERDKGIQPDLELAKELNMAHSETIISLLHRAYKYNRGPTHKRRQLHIACSLADEHFGAGAYPVALKYYAEISHSRGLGQWSRVLQHVRARATECARKMALPVDFVTHALDWLSSSGPFSPQEEREKLFREARQMLETLPTDDVVTLDLAVSNVVEVSASWDRPSSVVLPFEEPVVVLVSIKSRLPTACAGVELRVDLAGIAADNGFTCQVIPDLVLAPNERSVVPVSFGSCAPPLARLSIARVTLHAFGGKVLLRLGEQAGGLSISGRPALVKVMAQSVPDAWLENDLIPLSVVLQNPPLEKEIVRGRLFIDYHDSATGRTLPVSSDGVVPVYLLRSHQQESSLVSFIALEEALKSGESIVVSFALRFVTFGEQSFSVRFDYETADYAASSKLLVPIKVLKPFLCKFQLHRDTMQPLPARNAVAWVNRPLLISALLENCCEVPLSIAGLELVVEDAAAAKHTSAKREAAASLLAPQSQFSWWESVTVQAERAVPQSWGHLLVRWKNEQLGEAAALIVTKLPLPQFSSGAAPFGFALHAPATAVIGEAFVVTVRVANNSSVPHQMFLFTRERRMQSEVQAYVLDGMKSAHFKVLPQSVWEAHYRIIALVPGELPLPSFVVKSKRDNSTVEGSEKGCSVTVFSQQPEN